MTSTAGPPSNLPGWRASAEWLFAFLISLATAMLLISPFFWLGNASGHDISFHASSWMDAAAQWKEGILYPRWAEWANYGFGEPRFLFYPPLSWMLGAALSFVVPWGAVPGTFIVLVQTIAGLCFFGVARRFLSPGAALLGAACYAANPYAQLVIYMRSDFAELLACALMPVLLLATMELAGLVEKRTLTLSRAIAIFAAVFAGVWLSNAPAGVLASYSAVLIFAWAALTERSWRPLLLGIGGLALGFGLTGVYLVPAAYEQRWVNIAQALSSGLLPSQNFLYAMIQDPEHNAFNWIASTMAILMIGLTGIAGVAARRKKQRETTNGETEKLWRALMLLAAVSTLLMIRVSSTFWEHLPKLRFVQFPWRWMAVLAVPFAYFIAASLSGSRRAWIVWGAVVVLVAGGTGTFLVHATWWDAEDIPTLLQALASDQGFEGTDEYDPVADDHYSLPQNAPRVQVLPAEAFQEPAPKAEIHVDRWNAEEKELTVTSPQAFRLAVRLLNYPAWRVEVNGKAMNPQTPEATAQIILVLPAGNGQRVSMKLTRTPDRTWGGGISAAAGIAFLALLLFKRRYDT